MIKELLPPSIKELEPLAQALEEVWQGLAEQVPQAILHARINELPEPVLDLLAWQFHLEGYELAQSVEEKRQMIKNAVELHRYKGTPYAVKKVLETLRINGQVKEWFRWRALHLQGGARNNKQANYARVKRKACGANKPIQKRISIYYTYMATELVSALARKVALASAGLVFYYVARFIKVGAVEWNDDWKKVYAIAILLYTAIVFSFG